MTAHRVLDRRHTAPVVVGLHEAFRPTMEHFERVVGNTAILMEQAAALPTSTETALFELVGQAGSDESEAIQKLVM